MSPFWRFAGVLMAAFVLSEISLAVDDYVPAPVPLETVVSNNGAFAFDIALAKRWRADPSTGTLRAVTAGGSRIVWKRKLPQSVRPRFALVADDGAVALFDQFDNIVGPIAVLLVNPQGQDVATLTFNDISRTIGAAPSDIVRQARHGAWIQTPPVLKGTDAHVGVAGHTLVIDLKRGRAQLATP